LPAPGLVASVPTGARPGVSRRPFRRPALRLNVRLRVLAAVDGGSTRFADGLPRRRPGAELAGVGNDGGPVAPLSTRVDAVALPLSDRGAQPPLLVMDLEARRHRGVSAHGLLVHPLAGRRRRRAADEAGAA